MHAAHARECAAWFKELYYADAVRQSPSTKCVARIAHAPLCRSMANAHG
jgi:hypothetical protein